MSDSNNQSGDRRGSALRGTVVSRRDLLSFAAGAFALSAVPLGSRQRERIVRRTIPGIMGTTAEYGILHSDEDVAEQAITKSFAELKRIEQMMTRFSGTSDIGRANAAAGRIPVRVSAETAFVLDRALAWSHSSAGGFDPALARVADLWDVKHRHEPPPAGAVQRFAHRHFYKKLQVDASAEDPTIFVTEADAMIDLGGIGCGYAVDRATRVLRDCGIRNGYINVGGDIYALGHNSNGEPWQIGVRSPTDPDGVTGMVSVSDAAIATSGDYEQGFTFNGRRYHHILDPETATPRVAPVHSVTVVADSCIDADAASTAVFGMSAAASARLLSVRAPGARVVASA